MTVSKRREVVDFFKSPPYELSERASCALVGLHRSTCQYESVREDDAELVGRIRELAQERPRYGYRRICALLRREGRVVNKKLVYRLYKAAGARGASSLAAQAAPDATAAALGCLSPQRKVVDGLRARLPG